MAAKKTATKKPTVKQVTKELESNVQPAQPEAPKVKAFQVPLQAMRTKYHHDTDECSAVLEPTGVMVRGETMQYGLQCSGCGEQVFTTQDPMAISWVEGQRKFLDEVH